MDRDSIVKRWMLSVELSNVEIASAFTIHCHSALSRVIIGLDAARLSLLSVSGYFANVLRCGDARAGATRSRPGDRVDLFAADQFASRTYLFPACAHSLCAAARNPQSLREESKNCRELAAEFGRTTR